MAEIVSNDRQKGKPRKKLIKIDMTPMVDLGFLLITFFMFTTNFTKPNVMDLGLPAKTPIPTNNVIDDRNQITFLLGKDNRVFYHQSNINDLNQSLLKETDLSSVKLSKIISEAYKAAPIKENFTIIIKPTDDSNYKNFVDILDQLAISKQERYGLAEMNTKEKELYIAISN